MLGMKTNKKEEEKKANAKFHYYQIALFITDFQWFCCLLNIEKIHLSQQSKFVNKQKSGTVIAGKKYLKKTSCFIPIRLLMRLKYALFGFDI